LASLLASLLAASRPRLGRRANPHYPVSNGTSNPPPGARRTSMGRWEASGEQRRQTRTLAGVRPGGWSARGTPSGALVAVGLGGGLRPDPDHVPVPHVPPPAHDRLLELPRTSRSGADRRDARDQPDHRLGAGRGLDGGGGVKHHDPPDPAGDLDADQPARRGRYQLHGRDPERLPDLPDRLGGSAAAVRFPVVLPRAPHERRTGGRSAEPRPE